MAAVDSANNGLLNTVGEQSSPIHITIDTDAAGHGWFVDPTPNDNSEFTHAQNAAGTDLLTDPSNAAAGHLDLLTTVTHELGHVLGLDDETLGIDRFPAEVGAALGEAQRPFWFTYRARIGVGR